MDEENCSVEVACSSYLSVTFLSLSVPEGFERGIEYTSYFSPLLYYYRKLPTFPRLLNVSDSPLLCIDVGLEIRHHF